MLNKYLLCWGTGWIRDDEFQNLVKYNLSLVDEEMANLMFILFKRDKVGAQIFESEISQLVSDLESQKKLISNVAQQLFHHPSFSLYKKTETVREDQVLFMNQFKDDVYQYNQKINLGIGFSVKGLYFSNNDKYLMVMGYLNVLVIDVKSGQKIYS